MIIQIHDKFMAQWFNSGFSMWKCVKRNGHLLLQCQIPSGQQNDLKMACIPPWDIQGLYCVALSRKTVLLSLNFNQTKQQWLFLDCYQNWKQHRVLNSNSNLFFTFLYCPSSKASQWCTQFSPTLSFSQQSCEACYTISLYIHIALDQLHMKLIQRQFRFMLITHT